MSYSFHACETDVTNATFGEGDIFQREKYADNLTMLVRNTTCPYVIALSSPWGSGKTYFLNAWKNKIAWQKSSQKEDAKVPCAYFSAWESENEADPLIAVVSSIRRCLLESSLISSKKESGLFEKTVKVISTPSVLFRGATALAKGVVNHYTDNALDDIGADMAEKMGEEYFEKFDELQQDKIDFVKELGLIINEVKSKTNSPILVMIDELDRCKPDYVILLLERIKHLFQVPGLVFVLAIDKEQLHTTIEHTFGIKGVQRDIYLEKFIDIYYELPAPNIMEYARNLIVRHIDIVLNFNTELQEEYKGRMVHESSLSSDTFNAQYLSLSLFQQVLLGCVERFFEGKSVRGFEKKFYKFKTINDSYKPSFMLATLLFYVIISGCTIDELFSGKKEKDEKIIDEKMHFAILSYIISNIISSERVFIRIKDDNRYEINKYESLYVDNSSNYYQQDSNVGNFSYDMINSVKRVVRPYRERYINTKIDTLYKEITPYTQDQFESDQSLISKFHQEGLAELRAKLQSLLDFGQNFHSA